MGTIRKRHSAAFKAKVALEAAKEVKTLNELAAIYGVHQVQISKWKNELLGSLSSVFTKDKRSTEWMKERDDLYRQIGQVTVERDWLKKKLQSLG
jgi:transposase